MTCKPGRPSFRSLISVIRERMGLYSSHFCSEDRKKQIAWMEVTVCGQTSRVSYPEVKLFSAGDSRKGYLPAQVEGRSKFRVWGRKDA